MDPDCFFFSQPEVKIKTHKKQRDVRDAKRYNAFTRFHAILRPFLLY